MDDGRLTILLRDTMTAVFRTNLKNNASLKIKALICVTGDDDRNVFTGQIDHEVSADVSFPSTGRYNAPETLPHADFCLSNSSIGLREKHAVLPQSQGFQQGRVSRGSNLRDAAMQRVFARHGPFSRIPFRGRPTTMQNTGPMRRQNSLPTSSYSKPSIGTLSYQEHSHTEPIIIDDGESELDEKSNMMQVGYSDNAGHNMNSMVGKEYDCEMKFVVQADENPVLGHCEIDASSSLDGNVTQISCNITPRSARRKLKLQENDLANEEFEDNNDTSQASQSNSNVTPRSASRDIKLHKGTANLSDTRDRYHHQTHCDISGNDQSEEKIHVLQESQSHGDYLASSQHMLDQSCMDSKRLGDAQLDGSGIVANNNNQWASCLENSPPENLELSSVSGWMSRRAGEEFLKKYNISGQENNAGTSEKRTVQAHSNELAMDGAEDSSDEDEEEEEDHDSDPDYVPDLAEAIESFADDPGIQHENESPGSRNRKTLAHRKNRSPATHAGSYYEPMVCQYPDCRRIFTGSKAKGNRTAHQRNTHGRVFGSQYEALFTCHVADCNRRYCRVETLTTHMQKCHSSQ